MFERSGVDGLCFAGTETRNRWQSASPQERRFALLLEMLRRCFGR